MMENKKNWTQSANFKLIGGALIIVVPLILYSLITDKELYTYDRSDLKQLQEKSNYEQLKEYFISVNSLEHRSYSFSNNEYFFLRELFNSNSKADLEFLKSLYFEMDYELLDGKIRQIFIEKREPFSYYDLSSKIHLPTTVSDEIEVIQLHIINKSFVYVINFFEQYTEYLDSYITSEENRLELMSLSLIPGQGFNPRIDELSNEIDINLLKNEITKFRWIDHLDIIYEIENIDQELVNIFEAALTADKIIEEISTLREETGKLFGEYLDLYASTSDMLPASKVQTVQQMMGKENQIRSGNGEIKTSLNKLRDLSDRILVRIDDFENMRDSG